MFQWDLNKGLAEILLSAQHLLMWSFSHNNCANSQYIEADMETNTHTVHVLNIPYELLKSNLQAKNLFTEEINEYFLDNE